MGADVELYEDPSGLPYDDLVAAWGEVDSRSAWLKARLAAAVPKGKLKQYAEDVGVAYQTVKNYRLVAEAYPLESTDVGTFPFGAAEALRTQGDRLELASREQRWTVREARELVRERAKPQLTGGGKSAPPGKPQPSGKPSPEPVSAGSPPNGSKSAEDCRPQPGNSPDPTGSPAAGGVKADPVPHIHEYTYRCECGKRDKVFDGSYDALESKLTAEIGQRYRQQVTALQDQSARLSERLSAAEQAGPGNGTPAPGNAADCAHGAAWHEQAVWLHALVAAKGWAWDGRQFAKPGPAGQAAIVAGKHAGHRVTTNGKNSRARCETCKTWFDTAEKVPV